MKKQLYFLTDYGGNTPSEKEINDYIKASNGVLQFKCSQSRQTLNVCFISSNPDYIRDVLVNSIWAIRSVQFEVTNNVEILLDEKEFILSNVPIPSMPYDNNLVSYGCIMNLYDANFNDCKDKLTDVIIAACNQSNITPTCLFDSSCEILWRIGQ